MTSIKQAIEKKARQLAQEEWGAMFGEPPQEYIKLAKRCLKAGLEMAADKLAKEKTSGGSGAILMFIEQEIREAAQQIEVT